MKKVHGVEYAAGGWLAEVCVKKVRGVEYDTKFVDVRSEFSSLKVLVCELTNKFLTFSKFVSAY